MTSEKEQGLARRSFDPLRMDGTELPANLLMAAKLVVFCLFVAGYVVRLPVVWLPMWRALDALPPQGVAIALKASFCIGALLLFTNRGVRTGAILCGLPFLLEAVVTRVGFYYANFFCGAFLVLVGLYRGRTSLGLLHGQYVVMYFGSGLNKLLDADWRDGHYIEHWLGEVVGSARYERLAALLPDGALALGVSWSSIVIELGLALLFLVPAGKRFGVPLAILFHIGTTVLVRDDFGVFVVALVMSFLVFVPWPGRGGVEAQGGALWRRVSSVLDRDGLLRWEPAGRSGLVLRYRGGEFRGLAAWNLWLLLHPFAYFVCAYVIAMKHVSLATHRRILDVVLVGGAAWFLVPYLWQRLRTLRAQP